MNKVMLVGNLTRDPEVRTTQSGLSVCQFSIAINRRFNGPNGEKQADYIPIVAWRQLADLCGRYLAKGRKVSVVGSLQSRQYEDKQGNKRTAYEVVADEIEFLSPRGEGSSPAPAGSGMGAPRYQNDSYDDVSGFTEMEDSALPF
jgi:single-strand DNA-binding protein